MGQPQWLPIEDKYFIKHILPNSEYATGEFVKGSGNTWAELEKQMTDDMTAAGITKRVYKGLSQQRGRRFCANAVVRGEACPLYLKYQEEEEPKAKVALLKRRNELMSNDQSARNKRRKIKRVLQCSDDAAAADDDEGGARDAQETTVQEAEASGSQIEKEEICGTPEADVEMAEASGWQDEEKDVLDAQETDIVEAEASEVKYEKDDLVFPSPIRKQTDIMFATSPGRGKDKENNLRVVLLPAWLDEPTDSSRDSTPEEVKDEEDDLVIISRPDFLRRTAEAGGVKDEEDDLVIPGPAFFGERTQTHERKESIHSSIPGQVADKQYESLFMSRLAPRRTRTEGIRSSAPMPQRPRDSKSRDIGALSEYLAQELESTAQRLENTFQDLESTAQRLRKFKTLYEAQKSEDQAAADGDRF